MTCNLTAVAVSLEEITDENREAVLALRVAPGQEQFVSSVQDSLAEAAEYPHAKPWYRAVFASGEPAGPVGFVMVSWNCEPQPQSGRDQDAVPADIAGAARAALARRSSGAKLACSCESVARFRPMSACW
jgi:hypothetical protein